jgi:hypothetical protein
MLRAVVVGVALLTAMPRAEAMCAENVWFGAPRDGVIPPGGSLYVAYSTDDDLAIEPRDRVRVTPLSRHVARIDYALAPGAVIEARLGGYTLARVKIGSEPRELAAAPRVIELEHAEHRHFCSTQDSFIVRLDQQVAAVRVRWLSQLHAREWVLPPEGDQLELGMIGCAFTTIPPRELHHGGTLWLTAIRYDGSEVPIDEVPRYLQALGPLPDFPDIDAIDDPLPDVDSEAHQRTALPADSLPWWLALVPLTWLSRSPRSHDPRAS